MTAESPKMEPCDNCPTLLKDKWDWCPNCGEPKEGESIREIQQELEKGMGAEYYGEIRELGYPEYGKGEAVSGAFKRIAEELEAVLEDNG